MRGATRDFCSVNGLAVGVQSGLQVVAALALLLSAAGCVLSAGPCTGAPSLRWGSSGCWSCSRCCSPSFASDAVLSRLGRTALIGGGALHLLGTAVLMRSGSMGDLRPGTTTR
ncbi:hypothetical protein [Micromonospora sp. NPDC023737]|uniref:hypothetical protein n=1 Tax=unclassified Micromonospora TaxID=2617518 RepID=UPI00340AA082